MSVSTIAGQIATLAGHAPKQAASRRTLPAKPRFRKHLRNHPTLARTTIKGRGAILFGGAFVAMAAMILLMTTGVIPTEEGESDAPMWLIALCAGLFGIPGLWVMYYGVATSIADARVRRQMQHHPDSPWYYDYPWSEYDTTYSDLRSIRQMLLLIVVFAGFAAIGHFIANEAGRGIWPLWIVIGLFDLVVLAALLALLRSVIRLFRYGRSRLRFDRFPFRLGGRLSVTWLRPRGMTRSGAMTCTLRCIEEKFESAGEERGQTINAYAIYEEQKTIEPPMDRAAAFTEVPLSFNLPAGVEFDSRLRDHPPRYWQLEIRAENGGVDYLARFLTPVYDA